MRITHVITFDQGSGPTTLVEIASDTEVRMVRIVHRARFDKVKEVDPLAARAALDRVSNLGEASTKVPEHHARAIAQEALRFAMGMGSTSQALRWGADGVAVLFRAEADAVAWDQANQEGVQEDRPRRRRMIMG